MPTPSGRPTAAEKRAAKAAKERAANFALGDAWDLANGGVAADEAAEILDAANANVGERVKREYRDKGRWFAVQSALDRLGPVRYPAYVLVTTQTFMLTAMSDSTYGIELRRQTDADVARSVAWMREAVA